MPAASLPRLLALAAMTALAACVQVPPRPLDAGVSAASFRQRSLDDPGLRRFLAENGARSGAWGLERLALAASYFHGEVAIARAAAEEAAASVITAGQRPNPILSFAPGYAVSSSGISPWLLLTGVDVPIETAGKRGRRLDSARAAVEAAQLRVADAAWSARTRVRAALLDVYFAQQNEALIDREIALHEEVLRRLEAQVKAGESPAFELTQARLALNRSRLTRHDVERSLATARVQLASAVGVPTAAIETALLDFSAFAALPAVPESGARRRALTHRADLLAALADYAGTEADLRLQLARQYPDIRLGPAYELDQTVDRWTLGFTMELPLLSRNRGQIAQAVARRKSAAARFEARQAAVFGEIDSALAAYRSTRAKAQTAATLADEATRASSASERLVGTGEIAAVELTRRQLEVSAARASQLQAQREAQQAAGALEAALQTPLRTVR